MHARRRERWLADKEKKMKKTIIPAVLAAALTALGASAQAFPGRGFHHGPPSIEDMDTDGDGVVSSDEFVAPAVEHYTEIDADGDGSVTVEEFVAPARERFTEIDANGDGSLTEDELEAGRPGRRR
jgi:hypothetical protein